MLTVKQITAIIRDTVHVTHDDDGVLHKVEEASQKIYDLCKPDHGIDVQAAVLENEVTSTLMDMVLATALALMIEQEGGGRANISISPLIMSQTLDSWDFTVEVDGLIRTVRVSPKDRKLWEAKDDADEVVHGQLLKGLGPEVDNSRTKPPAPEHVYDRPVWAVRVSSAAAGPTLMECTDRGEAEDYVRTLGGHVTTRIENRCCLHLECPASGCNEAKPD